MFASYELRTRNHDRFCDSHGWPVGAYRRITLWDIMWPLELKKNKQISGNSVKYYNGIADCFHQLSIKLFKYTYMCSPFLV